MSRINTPATIADAPKDSQGMLEQVEKSLGSVPNLFRLVSNSPATLEAYLGFNAALGKGTLSTATRERIALVIANTNGCDYCNSAHTFLAKSLAKLEDAEIAANRVGSSTNAKAHAAVAFALKVATKRGHISSDDLSDVQAAGYSNAEMIEIIGHIALNIFTNYVNEAFETEIDFPLVKVAHAA